MHTASYFNEKFVQNDSTVKPVLMDAFVGIHLATAATEGLFTQAQVETLQPGLKNLCFHEPGLPVCTSIWFTTRLSRVSLSTDENLKTEN